MATAALRNLRCLQASAVCVQPQPSRQPGERPTPQRLCMLQGVPPNPRQQWAEAYSVVGYKVLEACAEA